jgi:hypothetical protein
MSDFRLKTKVEVDAKKAQERKKEVDEGMKLAKSVDLLRETYAQEQTKLRLFRESTLKVIKDDIDALEVKKNSMAGEIKALEARKIEAEAPIDLVKEWKKVKEDKKEIIILKEDILERENRVINKEIQIESIKNEFFEREEKIKENEQSSKNYLIETTKNYELSEKNKLETLRIKDDTLRSLDEKETDLRRKEQDLSYREHDLVLQKEQVIQDKIEIEKEKIHIQSQQQSLKVAWDRIRKLQANQ